MNHACVFCGVKVNPSRAGNYRAIVGWERVRSAGGANAVVMREETGAYACAVCIGAKRSGVDPRAQRSMFG